MKIASTRASLAVAVAFALAGGTAFAQSQPASTSSQNAYDQTSQQLPPDRTQVQVSTDDDITNHRIRKRALNEQTGQAGDGSSGTMDASDTSGSSSSASWQRQGSSSTQRSPQNASQGAAQPLPPDRTQVQVSTDDDITNHRIRKRALNEQAGQAGDGSSGTMDAGETSGYSSSASSRQPGSTAPQRSQRNGSQETAKPLPPDRTQVQVSTDDNITNHRIRKRALKEQTESVTSGD